MKRNGGVSALSGLLYQSVVDLGLTARAFGERVADNKDNIELEYLLSIASKGNLEQEVYDQDSVLSGIGLRGGDECVLIQYKYSRQDNPPTIGPDEFMGIIDKLDASTRRASQVGESVTGYALISNRSLGPETQNIIARTIQDNLKDELVKGNRVEIIKNTRFPDHTEMKLEDWLNRLDEFGEKYGVSEEEVQQAIEKLIGKCFYDVGRGKSSLITLSTLLANIVGYPGAKTLTPKSVRTESGNHITSYFSNFNLPHRIIRRDVMDEINDAVTTRAIVVLMGLGGCGKTISLAKWACENVEFSPASSKSFTHVSHVDDLDNYWVAKVVCNWMSLPQGHPRRKESLQDVIQRLERAGPNLQSPILYLGLDGLDEYSGGVERESQIKEILKWFLEEDIRARKMAVPPKSSLVITCRSEKVIDNWLYLDPTGYTDTSKDLYLISLDDFSDVELLKAAQSCEEGIKARIFTAIIGLRDGIKGILVGIGTPIQVEGRSLAMDPINLEVVNSLHHPGMWRAFGELSEMAQHAVLSGDKSTLFEMAEIFFQRFVRKVRQRGQNQNLDDDEIWMIIQGIANHCWSLNTAGAFDVANWINPACETGLINQFVARGLRREALSAGLIFEDGPSRWYWKHAFVWEYLYKAGSENLGNPKL